MATIYINPGESRTTPETGTGSQANPFTSFSSISANGAVDGDTVLILSGSFTRQYLNINNSSNFTLGEYGTGAKPIISGAEVDTNTWTYDGVNDVYYTDFEPNTATPLSLSYAYFADNVKLINYSSLANLQAAGSGQFVSPTTSAPTRIYVRLGGSDPNASVMEATTGFRAAFLNNCRDFTAQNLEFIRGGECEL